MSMPVLLETLICFLPLFGGFTFQNLEYCKCFPFTSENPVTAKDVKLITDIPVMNREGGGGNINLSKKEAAMVKKPLLNCSLQISVFSVLHKVGRDDY